MLSDRAIAIEEIISSYPVTADEVDAWALDEDPDVRLVVLQSDHFTRLKDEEPERYLSLLVQMAARYNDYQAGFAMRELAGNNAWFERVWQAAEELLDRNDINLNTMLICAFFEDVIVDRKMKPDDPHLQRWLDGRDYRRLEIMRYLVKYHRSEGPYRAIGRVLKK